MTDDARDDNSPSPYGDLPEGYGGIAPERHDPTLANPARNNPPAPNPSHQSGTNQPEWRKGPLGPDDIEPAAPQPPHWIERQAEDRRRRLKELEAQVEAEARGEKWEKADSSGWPPKPAAVPPTQPRVVTGSAWSRVPAEPVTEARTPPPPPPEAPPASDVSWMDPMPLP